MPHLSTLIISPASHVIVSIHRNVGDEFVVKSVVTVGVHQTTHQNHVSVEDNEANDQDAYNYKNLFYIKYHINIIKLNILANQDKHIENKQY